VGQVVNLRRIGNPPAGSLHNPGRRIHSAPHSPARWRSVWGAFHLTKTSRLHVPQLPYMRAPIATSALPARACDPSIEAGSAPGYEDHVLHTVPHDRDAFPDGLFCLREFLYEGARNPETLQETGCAKVWMTRLVMKTGAR
jgi:hypothetical protein